MNYKVEWNDERLTISCGNQVLVDTETPIADGVMRHYYNNGEGYTNLYCGGKFVGRFDETGFRTAGQVKALDDQQEDV